MAFGLAEAVAGFAEAVAGIAEPVAISEGLGERMGILRVALFEGPITSSALDIKPVLSFIKYTPSTSPVIIINTGIKEAAPF